MILGRIISDTEIEVGDHFECVTDATDATMEPTIPTIYIGMTKTNELLDGRFDIDLDILTRRISDTEFWTFTRKEQRTIHANDLMDFKTYCFNRLVENVKYEFIDPLLLSDEEHTRAFSKIKDFGIKVTYIAGDMVYIYNGLVTYGINLMFYQYMGADRTKLLKRIERISSVVLDTEKILIEYNDFMEEYNNDKMYIPYLYSIINDAP